MRIKFYGPKGLLEPALCERTWFDARVKIGHFIVGQIRLTHAFKAWWSFGITVFNHRVQLQGKWRSIHP